MPLFEYACRQCGHRFETLVTASRTAACPKCGSTELDKQHSAFGTGASGGRRSAPQRFT